MLTPGLFQARMASIGTSARYTRVVKYQTGPKARQTATIQPRIWRFREAVKRRGFSIVYGAKVTSHYGPRPAVLKELLASDFCNDLENRVATEFESSYKHQCIG